RSTRRAHARAGLRRRRCELGPACGARDRGRRGRLHALRASAVALYRQRRHDRRRRLSPPRARRARWPRSRRRTEQTVAEGVMSEPKRPSAPKDMLRAMEAFPDARVLLARYGLSAKKQFGQNFLISDRAFRAIVDATIKSDEDWVIEIGAGLGTLTMRLAE